MDIVKELEKIRASLSETVVTAFDRLIAKAENPDLDTDTAEYEITVPLSVNPSFFIGKKPAAVLFGQERIAVKSWHDVYGVILTRCNENPQHHETLMYLRNKAAGKCRVLLSGSPDGMTRPLKIDEGLYGETHYGAQTLMYILVDRILSPVGYGCSDVSIVIKNK